MTLDEFLKGIQAYQSKPKLWALNNRRETEIIAAYSAITEIALAEDPKAKFKCAMSEFGDGSGYIAVETNWFVVREIEKFIAAIQCANNLEVVPLTNGNIKITLTFHNIYTRII